MKADIEVNPTLSSSYVSTVIKDEASDEGLINVVGALIYKGELIAKGLSNGDGLLVIDFSSEYFFSFASVSSVNHPLIKLSLKCFSV